MIVSVCGYRENLLDERQFTTAIGVNTAARAIMFCLTFFRLHRPVVAAATRDQLLGLDEHVMHSLKHERKYTLTYEFAWQRLSKKV